MSALLALLLCCAPCALNQVQPDPAAVPDPAAILEQAARFQRGQKPLKRAANLHGLFHVTLRDPVEGNLSASIEQWYTREPERMLTLRRESLTDSVTTEGYDDGLAWFRDEQTGEVVLYSDDPEFDMDVEKLEDQLRMTRTLLDAVVLDALIPRLQDAVYAGEGSYTDPDGEQHPVRYVGAHLKDELFPAPLEALPPGEDEPQRLLQLHLAVDARTGALWALRVAALDRDDVQPLELRFAFHGRTPSGLRVPGNIKLFRAGAEDEALSLGVVESDEGELLFQVNAPPGAFPRFRPTLR